MNDRHVMEKVLLSEEEIQKRVGELAQEISRDYVGRELVLLGALKGAIMFLADLSRSITLHHSLDFVGASSYGDGTESSGEVKITKEAALDLKGKHVILVEDIYDTGLTMEALTQHIRSLQPASLEICVLLVKDHPRQFELPIRYAGFHIPDLFVVGYGLDYAQRLRNLRYVGVLRPAAELEAEMGEE